MNYFLISVPLALLNAEEAIYYYNLRPEECRLIVFYKSPQHIDYIQINRIIDSQKWSRVDYLPVNVKVYASELSEMGDGCIRLFPKLLKHLISTFGYVKKLNKIANANHCERIFVQDPSFYPFRHLSSKLIPLEIVVLDEGFKTKTIIEKIIENQRSAKRGPFHDIRSHVISKCIGYNVSEPTLNSVSVFSSMDFDESCSFEIIKNNYDYLRLKSASYKRVDEVYFIGQSLPETGRMTIERYVYYLRKVKEKFPQKPILYLPHREDSQVKLNIIREELGFEVSVNNKPLEMMIQENETLPYMFATFYSTAIVNLYSLLGGTTSYTVFKISFENLKKDDRIRIREAYCYLENITEDYFNLIDYSN